MSLHTFSSKATEPIEFGGDPALATARLTTTAAPLVPAQVDALIAICDTSIDAADRAQHLAARWRGGA